MNLNIVEVSRNHDSFFITEEIEQVKTYTYARPVFTNGNGSNISRVYKATQQKDKVQTIRVNHEVSEQFARSVLVRMQTHTETFRMEKLEEQGEKCKVWRAYNV